MEKLFENARKNIVETCSKLVPNEQATIMSSHSLWKSLSSRNWSKLAIFGTYRWNYEKLLPMV
jgi:hypothetical protein